MNYRYIVLICLIFVSLSTVAQLLGVEEVKGIDSTYIKEEYKYAFGVRNKSATFKDTVPYFIEYAQLGRRLPEIAINNKDELDVYVRVFIAPHFKKVDREFRNSELFSIALFCNLDGVIKDIEVGYPKDVQVPVSSIEQFHKAICSGNLRLVFDKTHKAFVDSPWVGRDFMYNSNTIKEMAP